MFKVVYDKLKDESGNTMIEATFVMTLSLIIVLLMLLFGFIFYQETLLQTVADDTARKIASTYTYTNKDPVTGYITTDSLRDQGFVDSMYFLTGENSGKDFKEEKEAKSLAKTLMNKKRLRACQSFEYNIDIRNSNMVFFQKEIVVSLEEKYSIPLLNMLGMNSSDGLITRKYTAKALCYDHIGAQSYYSTFAALAKNVGNLQLFKAIHYVVKTVKSVINGSSNLVSAFFEYKEGQTSSPSSNQGSSGAGHGGGCGRLDSDSGTSHGGGGGRLDNNNTTNGGSSTNIGSSGAEHGSGGGRIG